MRGLQEAVFLTVFQVLLNEIGAQEIDSVEMLCIDCIEMLRIDCIESPISA